LRDTMVEIVSPGALTMIGWSGDRRDRV